MKIQFKIVESNSEIQNKILKALLPQCDSVMRNAIAKLKKEIPNIIFTSILNRPEYQSLVSGNLRLEFGIPNASQKVTDILEFWTNNTQFIFSKPQAYRNQIKSTFSIKMIKTDFSDILGSEAAYVYDSIRGYNLPWLEWLLLEGNKIIVPGYSVIIGPSNRSRTGLAIMRESKNNWKVPSEFAGTENNNWITRAIDDSSQDILQAIERSLL